MSEATALATTDLNFQVSRSNRNHRECVQAIASRTDILSLHELGGLNIVGVAVGSIPGKKGLSLRSVAI